MSFSPEAPEQRLSSADDRLICQIFVFQPKTTTLSQRPFCSTVLALYPETFDLYEEKLLNYNQEPKKVQLMHIHNSCFLLVFVSSVSAYSWAESPPQNARLVPKSWDLTLLRNPRVAPRQLGTLLSVRVDPRAPGTNLRGHRLRGQPLGPDPEEPPGWDRFTSPPPFHNT